MFSDELHARSRGHFTRGPGAALVDKLYSDLSAIVSWRVSRHRVKHVAEHVSEQ